MLPVPGNAIADYKSLGLAAERTPVVAGVQGLAPDLADFWSRYLIAARDRGEIHQDTDIAEASEWVARVLLSLSTVPGNTLDPSDADAVAAHVRRYVMPGLRADPAV